MNCCICGRLCTERELGYTGACYECRPEIRGGGDDFDADELGLDPEEEYDA